MPRNRRRKPPAESVAARMEAATPEHLGLGTLWRTSCGRCGQHLVDFKTFLVKHGPGSPVFGWQTLPVPGDPSRTIESDAGWRWNGEVWEPTSEHRARRQAARAAVARGDATERDRERLTKGIFHRSRMRPKHRLSDVGTRVVAKGEANRLPATFRCPRCHALNVVDTGDDARYQLTKRSAVG